RRARKRHRSSGGVSADHRTWIKRYVLRERGRRATNTRRARSATDLWRNTTAAREPVAAAIWYCAAVFPLRRARGGRAWTAHIRPSTAPAALRRSAASAIQSVPAAVGDCSAVFAQRRATDRSTNWRRQNQAIR